MTPKTAKYQRKGPYTNPAGGKTHVKSGFFTIDEAVAGRSGGMEDH